MDETRTTYANMAQPLREPCWERELREIYADANTLEQASEGEETTQPTMSVDWGDVNDQLRRAKALINNMLA